MLQLTLEGRTNGMAQEIANWQWKKCWRRIKKLKAHGITHEKMSSNHARIDSFLDIYPGSGTFHNRKTGDAGTLPLGVALRDFVEAQRAGVAVLNAIQAGLRATAGQISGGHQCQSAR
jgi:hypothetical protein